MTDLKLTRLEIANKANSILREIHAIEPIDGIKYLRFDDVDFNDDGDYVLIFKGENIYKNPTELHTYSIPEELIHDKQKKNDFLLKLKEKVETEQMSEKDKDMKLSIKKYIAIKNKVETEAMNFLSQINDIKPITGFNYLEVSDFDDDSIEFNGEETWRYGGYENHSFEFPTYLLFNSTSRKNYLNKIKKSIEEKNKKEEEHKKKLANEKKDRDHKKYLELKNQFEANGE